MCFIEHVVHCTLWNAIGNVKYNIESIHRTDGEIVIRSKFYLWGEVGLAVLVAATLNPNLQYTFEDVFFFSVYSKHWHIRQGLIHILLWACVFFSLLYQELYQWVLIFAGADTSVFSPRILTQSFTYRPHRQGWLWSYRRFGLSCRHSVLSAELWSSVADCCLCPMSQSHTSQPPTDL